MMCDQYDAVRDDLSTIDRMQDKMANNDRTVYEGFVEMFGEPCYIFWLLTVPRGTLLPQPTSKKE